MKRSLATTLLFPLAALLCLTPSATAGSTQGIDGTWRTPGGAVVRIGPCGSEVCATLLRLEPKAPTHVDSNNPDPSLRTRPLCGLQIGYGFRPVDADHAEDGHLYDPKSGKTYKGAMASSGDQLELRGYIGLKAFGRTERWTRTSEQPGPCA